MRIVFLGTPEIAQVCLAEILKTEHEIIAVVTKPDKPVGRGNKIAMSPVKKFALEQNLKVYQFNKISKEGVEILKDLKPDLLVLVAFGQILSQEILDIALPINLHGSLLPKYRGPSPIQSAILNGEKETGLTIMKMESEVDSGDILLQEKIKIDEDETSGTLFEKMAQVGSKAMVKVINLIADGKVKFTKQDHSQATFTTMLTKDNAKIDFNDTVENIINKIRAYNPNPIAYFEVDETKIKVYKAKKFECLYQFENNGKTLGVYKSQDFECLYEFDGVKIELYQPQDFVCLLETARYQSGEIIFANWRQGFVIMAKDGPIEILQLQSPNGKILTARQYLNGNEIIAEKVNS